MVGRGINYLEEVVKKITNVAATIAVALMVVGALFTTATAVARSHQNCLLVATVCEGDTCSPTKTVTVEVGINQKYSVTLEGAAYLLAEQRCEQGSPRGGKLALKYTAPGGNMNVVDIDARTNTRRVVITGTEGQTEVHKFDYCGNASQRAIFTVTRPEVVVPPEPTEEEIERAAEERIDKLVRELKEAKKELKTLVKEKRRKKEDQIRKLEDALRDAKEELKEAQAREEEIEQQLAPPAEPEAKEKTTSDDDAKVAAVMGGFIGGGGTNPGFGSEVMALWHVVPTDGVSQKWGFSIGAGYRWLKMEKPVVQVDDLYIESNNHAGFGILALHWQPSNWFNAYLAGLIGGGTEYQGPGDGRNPQREGFFLPGADLTLAFAPVHWLNIYVGGGFNALLGTREAIAPAGADFSQTWLFLGKAGVLATF